MASGMALEDQPVDPGATSADDIASIPDARWRIVAPTLIVAALAFGGWGLWRVLAPPSADLRAQLAGSERLAQAQRAQIEQLQQRVTTLVRSDQIRREANRDLQR